MATVKFTVGGFRLAGIPPHIRDTFDRADGPIGTASEGETPATWSQVDAVGFVTAGGYARAGTTTATSLTNYRTVLDVGVSDFYVEATLGPYGVFLNTQGAVDPGLLARYTDTSNYLRLEHNYTAGWQLRNVGGGGTNSVLVATGLNWAEGQKISLRLVGTSARVTVGGQSFEATAPNNLTGTKAGLLAKSSTTAYVGSFADFTVRTGTNIPA